MAFAKNVERPRSESVQDLSCITHIVLPKGQYFAMPFGKFTKRAHLNDDLPMQTVYETRRARLEMLIKKHGGMLANLNEAIGLERNHTQLARIRNNNARTDRPGKTFTMGDAQAREIESKLGLEIGWMDTPPNYADLHQDDRISHVMRVMESMPEWQRDQAMRLIDTIAEPIPKQGNGH